MASLTLIRGVPGSGKTTLASVLLLAAQEVGIDVRHFEADHFFEDEEGNYNFDINKRGEAHKQCQENTRKALEEGVSVIVSNTFTTIRELRPYFKIAKEFGIVPNVILSQNNFGSTHDVPEDTMTTMRKRFVYNIDSLFESLKDKEKQAA